MKRAAVITSQVISRPRFRSRSFHVERHDGIQPGIHARDPRKLQIEQLQRAEPTRAKQGKKRGGGAKLERECVFVVHICRFPPDPGPRRILHVRRRAGASRPKPSHRQPAWTPARS